MKKFTILFLLCVFALSAKVQAQNYYLRNNTNAQEYSTCSDATPIFYDDGGANNKYTANINAWVAFNSVGASAGEVVSLFFDAFDIAFKDTMYIYDGPNTSSPLMKVGPKQFYFADSANSLKGYKLMPSASNSSKTITIRFKSTSSTVGNGHGWKADVRCEKPLQTIIAGIESFFLKYNRTTLKFDTFPVKTGIDAPTVLQPYPQEYKAIDICIGDSIKLIGKANYPESEGGYYPQSDATSSFYWIYGDRVRDTGRVVSHKYTLTAGYNIGLRVDDPEGGRSINDPNIRVRIAKPSVGYVKPIPDMCTGTSQPINVGTASGSFIKLDPDYDFHVVQSIYSVPTFIPDGPNCLPIKCYETSVVFDQYAPGLTVESGSDICAVCLNMVHSYPGDLGFTLICPTGKRATLMTQSNQFSTPPRPPFNGAAQLGDNVGGKQTGCNPASTIRVGWDYCWSEQYKDANRGTMGPLTRGGAIPPITATDYENKRGFFQPDSSFSSLIGCPLNGKWTIEVCDNWTGDNGWVFSWSMEFCGFSSADWKYSVGVDSIFLKRRAAAGSKDTQSFIKSVSKNTVVIQPTEATYPNDLVYNVTIVDSFACYWDTMTSVKVIKTPMVNLNHQGKHDVSICEGYPITLNAGNADTNTTYMWEPTNDTTQIIQTYAHIGADELYKVQVIRRQGTAVCKADDQMQVHVQYAPATNFKANVYPMEGCEPLYLNLKNNSAFTDSIEWYIDDKLETTLDSLVKYFPATISTLKIITYNKQGCSDTITYVDMIRSYASPKADFRWTPQYPSSGAPEVKFINKTTPGNPYDYKYVWQIQNDLSNPNSFDFINDSVEPTYSFKTLSGAYDISGDYWVYLIVKNTVTGESGYSYECSDTTQYQIAVYSEFLQFPNVVTPNGDGFNDVFQIKSLVSGRYFPNNELRIKDRWGKTIFQKKNMREGVDSWDPKATNTPPGVYFYEFVGKGFGKDVEYIGAIEVLYPK